MTFIKKEKKVPVDQLRESHLSGPADMSLQEASEALKDEQVVAVCEKPDYEKVVFRNQRDPGHPLEFHHSSKSHPFKQYTLIDGHKYDLPKEVIRSLEACRENKEKYRKNSDGVPEIYVAGYKSHFVFERSA